MPTGVPRWEAGTGLLHPQMRFPDPFGISHLDQVPAGTISAIRLCQRDEAERIVD